MIDNILESWKATIVSYLAPRSRRTLKLEDGITVGWGREGSYIKLEAQCTDFRTGVGHGLWGWPTMGVLLIWVS